MGFFAFNNLWNSTLKSSFFMDQTNAQNVKRKLAAILSADAKGYSRLMGEDEITTVQTLKACKDIIANLIQQHHGRVVDSPGDNILAEFASVVDAVQCALEIQEELKNRNADLPHKQKMEFRIGINLGDVIVDEERIYGDGVNIAARLEGLAEAGGICISGSAYDQVQNKLSFGCEYIGEQRVKNIDVPVKAYNVWVDPEADMAIVLKKKALVIRRSWLAFAVAAIIAAVAGAFYIWKDHQVQQTASVKLQSPQQVTELFSDKPSIAVLPFDNLSADAEQEYFSDGITNDLITDLSKFRELAVIASHTVFEFKGKSIDVRQLGRDLNVGYVLEGSIQKADDRVRINAQLIDTSNGNHIWADRYDRKIKDIFELQDEIIKSVVRKLALKVDETERKRAMRKDTTNLEAYDYILRGYHQYYKRTRNGSRRAKEYFKKAMALDSNIASAYVGLAQVRVWEVAFGYTEFPDKAFQIAEELLKKALSIDDSSAAAHATLGYVYMRKGEYDLAIGELQRAVELNPNDWRTYRSMAPVMLYSGRTEEALEWYYTAMHHDPAVTPGMFMNIAIAYFLKGQYDDAIDWLKKSRAKWPNFLGNHIVLAAVYGQMERLHEAKQEANEVLRVSPFFQVDFYGEAFRKTEHRDKIVGALRKAGLK
jgi:adenylate cyclase